MIGCDGCARRREKLKRLQSLAAERIRKVMERAVPCCGKKREVKPDEE